MRSEATQDGSSLPIAARALETIKISGRAVGNHAPTSHEELIEHAVTIVSRISRTFQGVSDTTVSVQKPKLVVEGDELSIRVKENFRAGIRYLLRPESSLDTAEGVRSVVDRLMLILNDDLVTLDYPKYRKWSTPFHPPPEAIEKELAMFCEEFAKRFRVLKSDPIAFAAWAERRFNIEIHPYGDGCGRCSKALGTFLLARGGLPYPLFSSREEYFDGILSSPSEWEKTYRAAVNKSLRLSA